MLVTLAYDRQTSVINGLNSSALDFAANTRRMPVAFRGTLRQPYLMRQLMSAMHEVIIGDFREEQIPWTLDPVITVHPDQVFFEAFSTDQSAYVRVGAAMDAFDVQDAVTYGTTNIDFTFAMRDAMQELRSSRKTDFTVGGSGFGMQTNVGAAAKTHIESKVDLPDAWVKGFLQVQSALAMKPFTFDVRPVDLMTVIHYFVENNARKPPRGMRFEFKPNEPIACVLEPWNEVFRLEGTQYTGYERTVRLWGRKRLELLLPVLPFADRVTVGLLGRGLPHFYICHCGPYTFTLVLSGWVRNDFSSSSALDLLAPQTPVSAEQIATVYNVLNARYAAKRPEVEEYTALPSAVVEAALFALCREGRAIYDPVARRYRSRELFAEPLNFETILAPDPRLAKARQLVNDGQVQIVHMGPSDTHKHETKIQATVQVGPDVHQVVVAIDNEGRQRFAQCDCAFFRDHILNLGPCEHILATRFASEQMVDKKPEVL